MKKEDFIKRYGEAAWEKKLQQTRDWNGQHCEEKNTSLKNWRGTNPKKVKLYRQKYNRKGGNHYIKMLVYQRTGLQRERGKIRRRHAGYYRDIKQATPNSQIHHEWIPGTAKYRGVALVETEAHRNGIIKVIKVLEGEITLFAEKEIAEQEEKKK